MNMIINQNIGESVHKDGRLYRQVFKHDVGHILYGPYVPVTLGVYQIDFTLALSNGKVAGDPICAVLDAVCDVGATPLAQRSIRVSELTAEPQTFSLLFVLRRMAHLEYRVAVTGQAGLRVDVAPTLKRVASILDETPRDGLETTQADPVELGHDTRRILRPLNPLALKHHGKIRMGNPADGGYVCVDDFAGIDTALSFGINDDISWDLDAAARGLRIYQFDHTVADPAPHDPRMVFEAKRIDTFSGDDSQSLSDLIRRHDKGETRPNIILKMDIEGGEWGVIESTPEDELARIAWIVCEMHYFQGLAERDHRARVDLCLHKLARVFSSVHIHGNVWGGFTSFSNVVFPNVLEATFANRACYELIDTLETFPGPLDRSCDPLQPDLYLGAFRF